MGETNDLEELFRLETFEAGGRTLWEGMNNPRDPEDVRALVVEMCRVKDRLDRLHRLASEDSAEWARLIPADTGGEYILQIDAVLREQRQTEIVFKQLTAEVSRRREAYDHDGADEEGGLSDL